jgi:hypothetical protein
MAVTGMASADDNSVCTALECAKNEDGVYSAGAGHADDLDVGRVCQTVIAGKVCTGIGTPVAAKCHDQGFLFVYLHIASTSAII